MPSIHSVARIQHLKQERERERMNNQITLKQQLLVATHDNIRVYLKDVNALGMTRLMYDSKINARDNLKDYLDYVVESVDENWNITIRSQKII